MLCFYYKVLKFHFQDNGCSEEQDLALFLTYIYKYYVFIIILKWKNIIKLISLKEQK